MTHLDTGRFAAKHPSGTTVAPEVKQAVQDQSNDQRITCHAAFTIAENLGVAPRQVGIAIDLQEGRIQKCQLGLFGYGHEKKAIKAAQAVASELKNAIHAALVDGRLPCAQAWRIADAAGIPRMAVANACECLTIKINKCQLGAF